MEMKFKPTKDLLTFGKVDSGKVEIIEINGKEPEQYFNDFFSDYIDKQIDREIEKSFVQDRINNSVQKETKQKWTRELAVDFVEYCLSHSKDDRTHTLLNDFEKLHNIE